MKNPEIYSDEYFDWWAQFLLKNSGERYALQSCDEALLISDSDGRQRVIKLRDAIIKIAQKSLN